MNAKSLKLSSGVTTTSADVVWLGPSPGRVAMLGVLVFLTIIGVAAGIGRLMVGLGATTALSDSYPWGIWIGFDFSLIAISGAGFTMAAVVHIFHLHRFHAALRPALLIGLLGYSAVLLLLVLDLGRPDRFYHFLIFWNLHSPLFEISWCVLLYTTVLVIEICPDLCQRMGWERVRALSMRVMAPVTILGVTLSTLHQSTLGTLYLNMPYRLDARWYAPLLPLLFYVSSIMAGLSVAIIAYRLAIRIHRSIEDTSLIQGLALGAAWVALLYVALRVLALWSVGALALLRVNDPLNWLLATELLLGALVPALLLLVPALRARSWVQWFAPLLFVGGVGLNRFDATLFAQRIPATEAVYVPHVMEWLSTVGILAGAGLVWWVCVRYLVKLQPDHIPHSG